MVLAASSTRCKMTLAEALAMTRDVLNCDVTKSHPVSVVLILSHMSESE